MPIFLMCNQLSINLSPEGRLEKDDVLLGHLLGDAGLWGGGLQRSLAVLFLHTVWGQMSGIGMVVWRAYWF